MKTVLIHIRPLDRKTNARVDVRIADGPSADSFAVGGVAWDPALKVRPKLSIELMSPDMSGSVQSGQGSFQIAVDSITAVRSPRDLYWKGAPVVVHSTGLLQGPTAVPDFVGFVTANRADLDSGIVTIDIEVSTSLIDKPLLTMEFTGGAGLGGGAEKRGVLWPAGFGKVNNIEPVWFDLINNIGMIDGYGNCEAIHWLGEGLSSFGDPVGNYDDYADLAAAIIGGDIAPGRWAISVHPGQPALIGLGAPPEGVITVHATFGAKRLGAMMRRVLSAHAGVPDDNVDAAAFAALDAAVPYPAHYWTSEQRNVKDLLEAFAQSCNATPLVSFQGRVTVTRAVSAAPVATIDRSGSVEPRVLDWQDGGVEAPFYILRGRTARPARVLSLDQVKYRDNLVDTGLYNDTSIYRDGNIVWLLDGSQWLYIGPPGSGNPPPTEGDANAFWQRMSNPTKAVDILYEDGRTVEELQPQDPGATRGAPAGTFIASVEATEALNRINFNADTMLTVLLSVDQFQALVNARTYVDGQPLTNLFVQERTERLDDKTAAQTNFNLLGSKGPDGSTWILNTDGVITGYDPNTGQPITMAAKLFQVGADIGEARGQIDFLLQTVVENNGVLSKAVLRVTSDGAIAGFSATADGYEGELAWLADKFKLIDPNGGQPFIPFSYSNNRFRMSNVTVDSLEYSGLVPLFGNQNNSLNPNSGFQILPGGFMMNWGRVRQQIDDETTFSVVFAKEFPNGVMSIIATPYLNTFNSNRDLWIQNVGNPARQGATFGTQSSTGNSQKLDGFDFIAFGY